MKSITSVNRAACLVGLLVVLCASWNACSPSKAMAKDLPDPNVPLNVPGFCRSTNDIKMYFDQHGVPVEIRGAKGKTESYCFVLASPYSGMDTTDLYCYVKAGEGWLIFLQATLWKTGPASVDFKADGDFMNVLRNDSVVLKINPPK